MARKVRNKEKSREFSVFVNMAVYNRRWSDLTIGGMLVVYEATIVVDETSTFRLLRFETIDLL